MNMRIADILAPIGVALLTALMVFTGNYGAAMVLGVMCVFSLCLSINNTIR